VKTIILALVVLAQTAASPNAPRWTLYNSGVTARLRGVSAPTANIVWASGSEGTIIRSTDGGRTWSRLTIPDTDKLDFRDIDAIDERTAYVLSIGNGDASRIYKTTDAGATWSLQFRNDDSKAFYDAMAFRDSRRGFAFSDSVDGQFVILRTDNGGRTWTKIPAAALPPALPGEGAYAASGSNIALVGDNVWIGTSASRVLRSTDGGRSWAVVQTPIPSSSSAGIFSIAFRDSSRGVIVGGDYKKESEAVSNAAITTDGGRTWAAVKGLTSFRSAVAYVPELRDTWIAVGPSGCDLSRDDARTWTAVTGQGSHAVSVPRHSTVAWTVGEKGSVASLNISRVP